MSDEMKVCVGQVQQSLRFILEFLHIVFTEVSETQGMGFEDHGGGKFLRHGDERDVFTLLPGTFRRRADAVLYLIEILLEHVITIMNPAPTPIEEARLAIEGFLAKSREPVLIEPGEEPVKLVGDNWNLEYRSGRLTIQAWDESRNIVRRVVSVSAAKPGRLELATERFGKRMGSMVLLDGRSARNHGEGLRATRVTFRESFRRSLRRQFVDWRIAELSTEADLEHSLSPAYPRALLRKGSSGWAAIAASPEVSDAGGVLTFGLIWLDYLRHREQRLTIEGLALFLPAGRELITCLRLKYLNPKAAQFAVFLCSVEAGERAVDLADYGNLETRLAPVSRCAPNQPSAIAASVQFLLDRVPDTEAVVRNDGSTSLRIRGLEFARATATEMLFGLDSRRVASLANLEEIEYMASELARMRSPEAGGRDHPLYMRHPEGWLESQVRANLAEVDARLVGEPVYGQVPAFTAGDRDVIDLLAVDADGRLTVMELKATEDIHLPMQALDYWMRVKWHADRGEFGPAGYFPGTHLRKDPPRLLLVAPALDFHPSNEMLLRYFRPDIQVERIGVGLEWRKKLKVMFRY